MNTITRKTFEGMDGSSKLNVLFDFASEAHERVKSLEKKVDRRRKFDTAFAGITGVIGGFLAIVGGKIFK